jgi:hypothetical protein
MVAVLAALFAALIALAAIGESLNWWNLTPLGPDVPRRPGPASKWEQSDNSQPLAGRVRSDPGLQVNKTPA